MRLTALLLATPLLAALGCAGGEIIIRPDPDSPAIVEIDPSIGGRGCLFASFEQHSDGRNKVEVVVAQDGSSDWGIFRSLSRISDIVGAVFGGGDKDTDGMQEPSAIDGCSQLFVSDEDEEKPDVPSE